jgi:hypothetical protein
MTMKVADGNDENNMYNIYMYRRLNPQHISLVIFFTPNTILNSRLSLNKIETEIIIHCFPKSYKRPIDM